MTPCSAHPTSTAGAWQRPQHPHSAREKDPWNLSCCPKALGGGRYLWHHDQVLKVTAEAISTGIINSNQQETTKYTIAFVKAGDRAD